MQNISFGANESKKDYRTLLHDSTLVMPFTRGGVDYAPADIENQRSVGICTAISLIQNVERSLSKKFSPDFQYLLQKKYIDGNWDEGSSIFSALKVGKNYGFLPASLFPITEADRTDYPSYIAKLQAIPDVEITRLIALCSDKLTGYAQIDLSDPQFVAKGINDSKAGILCRYEVGSEWWTATDGHTSWSPVDIDPLRPPKNVISGHAIGMPKFDYTANISQVLCNTWSPSWNKQGLADVNFNEYAPTEAWIPYYNVPVIVPNLPPHQPLTRYHCWGSSGDDVKRIQHVLGVVPESGFFGSITMQAVRNYQSKNGIIALGIVGPVTRLSLNNKFFN